MEFRAKRGTFCNTRIRSVRKKLSCMSIPSPLSAGSQTHAEFARCEEAGGKRRESEPRLVLIVLSIRAEKESGKNAESNCHLDHITVSVIPDVDRTCER